MITALLLIIAILFIGLFISKIFSRINRRREKRIRQMLELENTEYDYGHDVCHDETED